MSGGGRSVLVSSVHSLDRERELAALGHVDAALDPDDVADVEAEDAVVGLLPERVHAHDDLDRAGQVAQVQERRLAVPAPGDQAAGDLVAQLRVLAGLERARVVRGEHVGDPRARRPQADRRVGVDPFRAQPLHLGAAFVDLDHAVARSIRLLGSRACCSSSCCPVPDMKTILSGGVRLSSDRAGCLRTLALPRAPTIGRAALQRVCRMLRGLGAGAQAIGSDMPAGFRRLALRRGGRRRRRPATSGSTGSARRAAHRDQPARGLVDRLGGRVAGVLDHERDAAVGVLAQRHRQRHLAQQRHVELVRQLLAAALAEDREALAARAS